MLNYPIVGYAELADTASLAYPIRIYGASCTTGDPIVLKDGTTSSGPIAIQQNSTTDGLKNSTTFRGVTLMNGCYNASGATIVVFYQKV